MNFFKIILTLIIFLCAGLSYAQLDNDSDSGKDRDKSKLRGQLDSLIKEKLITKAGLNQGEADKLMEKYRESKLQIKSLSKEKRELMEKIKSDPTAFDMESKIDNLMKIESDIFDKRKNFITDLKTFLTPQQIAGTLILIQGFSKEIKKGIYKNKRKNRSKDDEFKIDDN